MVGHQMWDPNPSHAKEKQGIVHSLLVVCCYDRGGFYGKIVSQPLLTFLMWILFHFPICRSHSTSFWISFRGNCSVCSCKFGVSTGRGEFRTLPRHHLEPAVYITILIFIK